jgi:hypothetical protein
MLMGASARQESTHEDDDSEGHTLEPPTCPTFNASQPPSAQHVPSSCPGGLKHPRHSPEAGISCESNNVKAGKCKHCHRAHQEKKATDYAIRPSLSAHHPVPAHLTMELKTEDLPVARGGYVGKFIPHGRKVWTLQEL